MGYKETLGGVGYVDYFDYDDCIIGFCITHQIVAFKYVQLFVYQLYFDKSVKKCSLPKFAKAILSSKFLLLIDEI